MKPKRSNRKNLNQVDHDIVREAPSRTLVVCVFVSTVTVDCIIAWLLRWIYVGIPEVRSHLTHDFWNFFPQDMANAAEHGGRCTTCLNASVRDTRGKALLSEFRRIF